MEKEIVFDKYWFDRHQRKLLWLANSILGKYIFQFNRMGHYLDNKIIKITPNSVGELISFDGKKVQIKEHFFSRNEYARKLYWYLLPVWYFMHTWDTLIANTLKQPQLNFGFDTLTTYPDANAGGTTVDGYMRRTGIDETFSTIRGGNGTAADTSSTTILIQIIGSTTNNQYSRLARGLLTFDTSGLTSGATISAAVFSGATYNNGNGIGDPDLHVCVSDPVNNNSLQESDYERMTSTTSFASVVYASWDTTQGNYNAFTFNASGISAVSKTGITKLGLKLGWDISNSTTGLSWVASTISNLGIYSADNATTKPKLVITYTVPTSGASFLYNMI